MEGGVPCEFRGEVVDGHRRAVELDESVVEADPAAGLVALIGQQCVGDQLLGRVPAGEWRERVGDLVPPRQRSALIPALPCRTDERDADVVDRERVLLQRARGLLGADQLATLLRTVGNRLDGLGAGLGDVPELQPTRKSHGRDQPNVMESGEKILRPPLRCIGCVQLVDLAGGQQPMLIDAF